VTDAVPTHPNVTLAGPVGQSDSTDLDAALAVGPQTAGPVPPAVVANSPNAGATVPAQTDAGSASDADGTPESPPEPADARPAPSPAQTAQRARTAELFAEIHRLSEFDPARKVARDALIELHLPLVEYLARRFRNRGEPYEDLVQVGTIGLLKAVDRFDSDRGVEFSTYATPTVVGEIKRYFRDKGWAIRVPRRLQEMKLALSKSTGELSQKLGRSPTIAEIAAHLGVSEDEVIEGLESANAYSTISLDAPDSGDDDSPAMADTLGISDDALEGVEYRAALAPLLAQLPPRERTILTLRFFGGMTQTQIADRIGISQMHVSRLLATSLAQLREAFADDL
jgi:RNA polymerase sigma-B factor